MIAPPHRGTDHQQANLAILRNFDQVLRKQVPPLFVFLPGGLGSDQRPSGHQPVRPIFGVEPQGEFRQQQLDVWNEWGRRAPAAIVDVEGVPLSTVTFRR